MTPSTKAALDALERLNKDACPCPHMGREWEDIAMDTTIIRAALLAQIEAPAEDVEYIDTKGGEYKCMCGRRNYVATTQITHAATTPKQPDIAEKLAGALSEIAKIRRKPWTELKDTPEETSDTYSRVIDICVSIASKALAAYEK